MTATIIDGKSIAAEIRREIQGCVSTRRDAGLRAPGLAVVLIGDDPASQVYVRSKHRACQEVGMEPQTHSLPASTAQAALLDLIDRLNQDASVDGILVQLPLPPQIDTETIIERIDPNKDVDGFHPYNMGRLALKLPTFRPCTPYGVIKLLESTGRDLVGQEAVVVGASNIVGRPMSLELLLARATVTTCHSRTRDLKAHVGRADILVVAVGRMDIVQSEWIKPGSIVIDVGIHRLADGTLRGDLDFAVASERAEYITPVPGGVGPMTVAMLLHNTLLAAERRQPPDER